MDIGGNTWYTEADLYTLNNPPLCFEKKKRGKLPESSIPFDPRVMKMDKFVPQELTRRMITSTLAKQWDIRGKLTPVSLKLKHDLRMLIAEAPEWD